MQMNVISWFSKCCFFKCKLYRYAADLCQVNYFYQNQAEGLDTNKGVLQTLVEAAPDSGLNDLKALLGRMKFSTSFHGGAVQVKRS
jgi:ATPase subunit of ABC transporter with duplicated ATPase domains